MQKLCLLYRQKLELASLKIHKFIFISGIDDLI